MLYSWGILVLEIIYERLYLNSGRASVVSSVVGVFGGASAPTATSVLLGGSGRSVLVGSVHAPAQQSGDEEEDAVDDGEDPGGLQHGAWLAQVISEAAAARVAVVAKGDTDWNAQMSAVGVSDTTEQDDGSDESTDKAKVDQSDEWAGDVTVLVELIECEESPCASKDGDDEEGEEVVGYVSAGFDVWVDEPTQHANDRNGDEDFKGTDGREDGGVKHFEICWYYIKRCL